MAFVSGPGSLIVDVTPAVTAGAYSTGEVIGTKMTIANAIRGRDSPSGILQSIGIASKAALTVTVDVIIFTADPSASTIADTDAIAIDVADVAKVLPGTPVAVATKTDLGTPDYVTERNLAIPYYLAAGTSLYAVAVIRGSHTPGSTSDLTFRFALMPD